MSEAPIHYNANEASAWEAGRAEGVRQAVEAVAKAADQADELARTEGKWWNPADVAADLREIAAALREVDTPG